jgi:hypothetical protein
LIFTVRQVKPYIRVTPFDSLIDGRPGELLHPRDGTDVWAIFALAIVSHHRMGGCAVDASWMRRLVDDTRSGKSYSECLPPQIRRTAETLIANDVE